jgi:hypothetical protein
VRAGAGVLRRRHSRLVKIPTRPAQLVSVRRRNIVSRISLRCVLRAKLIFANFALESSSSFQDSIANWTGPKSYPRHRKCRWIPFCCRDQDAIIKSGCFRPNDRGGVGPVAGGSQRASTLSTIPAVPLQPQVGGCAAVLDIKSESASVKSKKRMR